MRHLARDREAEARTMPQPLRTCALGIVRIPTITRMYSDLMPRSVPS